MTFLCRFKCENESLERNYRGRIERRSDLPRGSRRKKNFQNYTHDAAESFFFLLSVFKRGSSCARMIDKHVDASFKPLVNKSETRRATAGIIVPIFIAEQHPRQRYSQPRRFDRTIFISKARENSAIPSSAFILLTYHRFRQPRATRTLHIPRAVSLSLRNETRNLPHRPTDKIANRESASLWA